MEMNSIFCHVLIINLQQVFRSLDCRLLMARDCRTDANNPKRVDHYSEFVQLHTFGDELSTLRRYPVWGRSKIIPLFAL